LGKTYFSSSAKQNSGTSVIPTPIVSAPSVQPTLDSNSATATPDAATANWKTFSIDNGFSFKYPPKMKIEEIQDIIKLSWIGPNQNRTETEFYDGISLNFQLFKSNDQNFKQIVENRLTDMKKGVPASDKFEILNEIHPITYAGLNGYSFSIRTYGIFESTNVLLQDSIRKSIYVDITDNSVESGKKGYSQEVDQILSTFKFTEKSDQTSDWQIYKNIKIGYQLKYPKDWVLKEIENENSMFGKPVKYIKISTPEEKFSLYFGFKKKKDVFLITDRTGVGAGDMQKSTETIKIINTNLFPEFLVFDNKIKEIFYEQPRDDKERDNYEFVGYFRFNSSNVNALDGNDMKNLPYLNQVIQILESVSLL
jgi:hypothetical protein